jgi:hypothetical protein
MLSTLDIISNGRIELGIGAGWHEEEYKQYGYDFPTTVVRIAQLDEAVSIIRAMWSKQNASSFNGNARNPDYDKVIASMLTNINKKTSEQMEIAASIILLVYHRRMELINHYMTMRK